MDFAQLGSDIVTAILGNIPSFAVVFSYIFYTMKDMKTMTGTFPSIASETKDLFVSNFTNMVGSVTSEFSTFRKDLTSVLQESKNELSSIVQRSVDEIQSKVNDELDAMRYALSDYRQNLIMNNQQTNLVVRENKAFIEIISNLITNNPAELKAQIVSAVATQLQMTKAELEKYPEQIMNELPVLAQSLKQQLMIMGEEKFEEFLRSIGYERKVA